MDAAAEVLAGDEQVAAPAVEPPVGEADGKKPNFLPPSARPTQAGPGGIWFDYNDGARVLLPLRETGFWRVRLSDLDTGNVLFESKNQGALIASSKTYFVRIRIEVWVIDDTAGESPFFSHDYAAAGHAIVIQLPVGTLGDTIGWFPYAARFSQTHGGNVTIVLSDKILPLLRGAYPNLVLLGHSDPAASEAVANTYASYQIGLFFDDTEARRQPTDFRLVGLHRTAGYILGVDPTEAPPLLAFDDPGPPIDQPYVCIAVQSSTQAKYWNNPNGWREIVAFLKKNGFRVICIDQKPVHGAGLIWTHLPHGAEDETGDRPLAERARWLKHAAFFIGLSSGLSWLAWAAGTPVVMISGLTHPTNEFATPYRVVNWHTCNSCWNDPALQFDHHDFLWCPRHKDTPRQFECTRLITAQHVMGVISKVPAFAETRLNQGG